MQGMAGAQTSFPFLAC